MTCALIISCCIPISHSMGIQSPCQIMTGMFNHLRKVFRSPLVFFKLQKTGLPSHPLRNWLIKVLPLLIHMSSARQVMERDIMEYLVTTRWCYLQRGQHVKLFSPNDMFFLKFVISDPLDDFLRLGDLGKCWVIKGWILDDRQSFSSIFGDSLEDPGPKKHNNDMWWYVYCVRICIYNIDAKRKSLYIYSFYFSYTHSLTSFSGP